MVPNIASILSQHFSYLAEGAQVFVYASQDGQYVLKILKTPEQTVAQWQEWKKDLGSQPWAPVPGDAFESSKILYKRSFESYSLANELRNETGLILLHLKKTS